LKLQVLCTLGPASLKRDVIEQLTARGVDLFRINLSHTDLETVRPTIDWIREVSSVPICLDTEGAQVRCGVVGGGLVVFEPGKRVQLVGDEGPGGAERLPLRPPATFRRRCPPSPTRTRRRSPSACPAASATTRCRSPIMPTTWRSFGRCCHPTRT
jgi:hypothetical protein